VTPKEKSQIKREPTSIKIDPQLWKEAKIEAINRDMDLSELVENALRKDLNKLKSLSEAKEK
jgi:post-segregation antitoxin (ccd killing protein)